MVRFSLSGNRLVVYAGLSSDLLAAGAPGFVVKVIFDRGMAAAHLRKGTDSLIWDGIVQVPIGAPETSFGHILRELAAS